MMGALSAVDDPRTSILEAARALAPEFRARAREAELERTMPSDLVHRAKAGGLFRLALPRVLGGLELDPLTIIDVIEEMSRADGSCGWTILIGNNTAFFAWLEPAVAAELIGPNPDFAATCMFSPSGRAVPDGEGAFLVEGRWPFSSGCRHADFLQTGVLVMDGAGPRIVGGTRPDWRFAFFAQPNAEILDTWDAAGLRGTGSHDVTVAGLRVPEEHTAAPFFEPARHDGPLWRIPFYTLAGIFLAGFPLGVARRALDEFVAVAGANVRGPAMETIASDAVAQVALARAEAGLQAARSFVVDAVGDLWATAGGGDPPSLHQRARVLLAIQQAMLAATDSVDSVFRLAGARTVYAEHPLQRCFRDLHTAAQHAFFHTDGLRRFAKLRLRLDQPTFML
jgi:alkylation response protein AidB-like acyl-CoA dehydrogenase